MKMDGEIFTNLMRKGGTWDVTLLIYFDGGKNDINNNYYYLVI